MEATKKECVQKKLHMFIVIQYFPYTVVQSKCIIKRYKVQGIPMPKFDQDAINRSSKYN